MQTAPPRHAKDPQQEARAHAEYHTLQAEARVLLIERDAIADLALKTGLDPLVVGWIGRAAYVLRKVAEDA